MTTPATGFRRLTVKITFLLLIGLLAIAALFLTLLFFYQRERHTQFLEERRALLEVFVEARRGEIVHWWLQASPNSHWLQFEDTVLAHRNVRHATLYHRSGANDTEERLAVTSEPARVDALRRDLVARGVALEPFLDASGPPGHPYAVVIGREAWLRTADGAGWRAPDVGGYRAPEAPGDVLRVGPAAVAVERASDAGRVLDYTAQIYLGEPSRETFTPVGHLVVRYSLDEFDAQIASIRRLFFGLLGVLLVGLLGLVNVLLERGVVRPIGRVVDAMRRAGGGDLDVRLEPRSRDEIGLVAERFNEMVADLQRAKDAIEDYNRTLEERVEARTAELRASEAEARGLRDHLSAIVQQVQAGVFALDEAGRVVTFNERAAEIVGRSADDVIGRAAGEAFGVPPLAALGTVVDRAVADRVAVRDEIAIGPAGSSRTCRVRTSPIARGTVVVLDDVTDLIYSKRLLAWREAVERVIHDIKNPLTPVRLSAQQIRVAHRDASPDFERIVDKGTSNILSSVDNLERMIADFSLLYRRPRARPSAVDLNAVVERVLGELAPATQALEIRRDLDPALEPITGDALSVWRLLTNLIRNGIEAMEEGGGTLTVRTRDRGDRAEVCVIDTGPGIPSERLDKLFEPYFTTKAKGTGLGLVIARQIVEDHGGRIEVESTEGHGTTVRFDLRR